MMVTKPESSLETCAWISCAGVGICNREKKKMLRKGSQVCRSNKIKMRLSFAYKERKDVSEALSDYSDFSI